ncbi:hypothetical protein [Streptomyces sp. CC228A]|uniref:hypothetical protein n=1 Tax=Streptomyces sp. CC228A TaxID=2898186 RepID=UPI001F205A13|nr:hypothetical protein [Streptomyces sp. CC228A]
MTADVSTHRQGILDTDIMILRRWVAPEELPDEMAITAITLAELSAGPHEVRRNDEQSSYDEHAERARRLDILQRAENEFDPIPFAPIPFDAEAARIYGRKRLTAGHRCGGTRPEFMVRRGRAVMTRQGRFEGRSLRTVPVPCALGTMRTCDTRLRSSIGS